MISGLYFRRLEITLNSLCIAIPPVRDGVCCETLNAVSHFEEMFSVPFFPEPIQ